MAGFYLHIPFCRKACHYCDFHFSTQLSKIDEMLAAMKQEIDLRASDWNDTIFETVYLGGGTPSLLSIDQLKELIDLAYEKLTFSADLEFTLECNPEDITAERLGQWKALGVNRLSIGIQSFDDRALKMMNRAHDSRTALTALEAAVNQFDRVSVDVIYGIPGLSDAQLTQDLDQFIDLGVTHISAYALTVEPKTALDRFIRDGLIAPVDEEQAERQFLLTLDQLTAAQFLHYELSNFTKPGHESRNNSAYWQRKPYLGIGPAAHSFKGDERRWNVASNPKYIKAMNERIPNYGSEILSKRDHYNEYVMTSLRTHWGVSLEVLAQRFGPSYRDYFSMISTPFLLDNLLFEDDGAIRATRKGKFLIDGVSSALFMLELKGAKE
ncbi:MAG: radical SAM family heme chaperone HemW [Flavobacteriaceae bacterium]